MRRLHEYLGGRVREERLRRNISFKFFARAMEMSYEDANALEEGRMPFTAETLLRVVIALGVRIETIWKIPPLPNRRSANEYNMGRAIELAERREERRGR